MSASRIKREPSWDWSGADSSLRSRASRRSYVPGSFDVEPEIKEEYHDPTVNEEDEDESGPPPNYWQSEEYAGNAEPTEEQSQDTTPRTWPSRTCRICLEVVPPTVHDFDALPDFLRSKPRVTYVSEDPELGRLIRPCKCKGTSRYVHEGCLQQWRQSDTTLRAKNYWSCPTCGFKYRLSRMTWGRLIKSTGTQIALTMMIFLVTVFLLGFVAGPIINFYLDPVDTLTAPILDRFGNQPRFEEYEEDTGWFEHFLKGIAGLGLLGAIKMFFTFNPWTPWTLRTSTGNRLGRAGRDRFSSLTWMLIVTGVITFTWVSRPPSTKELH